MQQLKNLRRRFDFKSSSFFLLKKIGIFFVFFMRCVRFILAGRPVCRFYISCSTYALLQFQEAPLHKACYRIIKRLLMCTPF